MVENGAAWPIIKKIILSGNYSGYSYISWVVLETVTSIAILLL